MVTGHSGSPGWRNGAYWPVQPGGVYYGVRQQANGAYQPVQLGGIYYGNTTTWHLLWGKTTI